MSSFALLRNNTICLSLDLLGFSCVVYEKLNSIRGYNESTKMFFFSFLEMRGLVHGIIVCNQILVCNPVWKQEDIGGTHWKAHLCLAPLPKESGQGSHPWQPFG